MSTVHLPRDGDAFVPYPFAKVRHARHGPLAGLRFAVKDVFDVRGYPTGAGNPELTAEAPAATTTATAVQCLLDAGAEFCGKTVTDEFAFSLDGRHAALGAPLNPAAPDRLAGGSSSGSASAVASGAVDFALASDTAGSTRLPACQCGVYGLRSSYGRASVDGMQPLAPTFDACGWLGRDIGTLERVCAVALGQTDGQSPLPALLSFDEAWHACAPVDDPTRHAAALLAQRRGGCHRLTLPGDQVARATDHFMAVLGHEAACSVAVLAGRVRRPLDSLTASRLAWARGITPDRARVATRALKDFRDHWMSLTGTNSVVMLPTVPTGAPRRGATERELRERRKAVLPWLCIAAVVGCPQLSIPVGSLDGVPRGLSLLGPVGSEVQLLAMARLLEASGKP